MSCSNCTNSGVSTTTGLSVLYNTACTTVPTGCPGDIAGFSYQGPNLPCTNIVTGTNMQDVIITFDTKLCAVLGDYTLYNKYCLDDVTPITSQQQFVESISSYVCTLNTTLTTFTDTTFATYQTTVDTRFDAIEVPGITSCVAVGISDTDDLTTVLTKLSDALCDVYDNQLDLSAVTWAQCFTVVTPPTTLQEAFDLLVDQICLVKADVDAGGTLPVFNNTGSCLPTPGALDSLEVTVNKIKTRLCESPTFDINALVWNCVTKPSTSTTDLQSAFQALMAKVDTLVSNDVVFYAGDFDVQYINPADPCLGKTVALATSSVADRYVATNVSDLTPGTLVDKLEAGTNIALDDTTTPGKIIINSTGGSSTDGKVKAGATDAAADYLINKIGTVADSYGISITAVEDTFNDQVVIANSINIELLASKILEAIANDATLLAQLCSINRLCPSPCASPANVTVTYVSGTTTTTTTSTTTTTAP